MRWRRLFKGWGGLKFGTTAPAQASAIQNAFERHMQRLRTSVSQNSSASRLLANIIKAFAWCRTDIEESCDLSKLEQDIYLSYFYYDLELRLGITIMKSQPDTAYTHFAKYGGYCEWLGNLLFSADDQEAEQQKNMSIFAHVIFVIDPETRQIFAHMGIAPNGRRNKSPITLLPADLLTAEERKMAEG